MDARNLTGYYDGPAAKREARRCSAIWVLHIVAQVELEWPVMGASRRVVDAARSRVRGSFEEWKATMAAIAEIDPATYACLLAHARKLLQPP